MTFRREVDHDVRVGHRFGHIGGYANVALDECEPRIVLDVLQVLQMPGVGQCVEHGDAILIVFLEHVSDKVTSYETGPAGHQQMFHYSLRCLPFRLLPHCASSSVR